MNLSADILTIGDELLEGRILNTNARFLGARLTELGFTSIHQASCADQVSVIQDRLREAVSRSEVIILTGGLGSTPDDVTRDAVADFLKAPLSFSKTHYRKIEKIYARGKWRLPDNVKKQALYLPFYYFYF